jgi:primary-amine oxidase
VQLIEAVNPSKHLALSYFDKGGPPPSQYVHVIIVHGSNETIGDYLVGPLPISSATAMRPLAENYHNWPIPLNAHATFNWTRLGQAFGNAFLPLDPVTRDIFNASVFEGTLGFAGVGPMGYDGKWRRTWVQLRRDGPGSWLRPLDLFVYVSRPSGPS